LVIGPRGGWVIKNEVIVVFHTFVMNVSKANNFNNSSNLWGLKALIKNDYNQKLRKKCSAVDS
jgi:hypothetical protein